MAKGDPSPLTVARFFVGLPEEMVAALIESRDFIKEKAARIRSMIEESEGKVKFKRRGQ